MPDDGSFLPYINQRNSASVDTGQIQAQIPPPAPFSAAGGQLYAIGQHELRMEVTTNGKTGGPFTDSEVLTVLPENVDPTWWEWDPDAPEDAEWNAAYKLRGTCINRSNYSGMQFTVDLNQTEDTGDMASLGTVVTHVDQQHSSPMLQFADIKQDWEWLIDGVWIPNGAPLFHEFSYAARMTLGDDYGNEYQAVDSLDHSVWVTVSDKKINEDAAAAALFVASNALTIGAIAAPWLAVGAAAAAIAASVLGAQAKDPRDPSRRFLRVVKPTAFRLPAALKRDKRLAALSDFLSTVLRIMGCMDALIETEARLRGAQARASQKGIQLQTNNYKDLVYQMSSMARQLTIKADAASELIGAVDLFRSRVLRRQLLFKKRIIKSRIDQFCKKQRIPEAGRIAAHALVSNRKVAEEILSSAGITRLFRVVALNVMNAVFQLDERRYRILKSRQVSENVGRRRRGR